MRKCLLIILFLFEWFALIVQLYLHVHNSIVSLPETVIRFFSYFTILTNFLAALCITFLLFAQENFFTKQSTLNAISVYIFIVGLVYNIILRSTWNPHGLQKIVDELLHLINPVLFIVYWLFFSIEKTLPWKIIFGWLLYPLIYIVYVLTRGDLSGFYPYPFIDAGKLSTQSVFINCIGLTMLFVIMSIIFLAAGNIIARKKLK